MGIVFDIPRVSGFNRKITAAWLNQVALTEGARLDRLNYKSFKRAEMIDLNNRFLQHDYDTDIISFPEAEAPHPISADFALGWDQIKEQATEVNEAYLRELHRVMVHGLLHCLGFDDKSDEDRAVMRAKEDEYLSLHPECSTWNKA